MRYEQARFSDVGKLVEFLNSQSIGKDDIVKIDRSHERWTLIYRTA